MYQILIVDDEAIEREVIRFLLKKYQFPLTVREASNGKEAMALLSKESFHILFTDIKMPYIDGLELASKARELFPDLYIIFFSGYDDFPYVKKALSLSVVNYILKPVKPEEFQKTISKTLTEISSREMQHQKAQEMQRIERNHILLRLLNGSRMEELQQLYPHFDLSFVSDYHLLFLMNITSDSDSHPATPPSSLLLEVLRELAPADCDPISVSQEQILLLFYGKRHHLRWYHELADQLIFQMRRKHHFNCYIAISPFWEKPDELMQAYEKTQTKLMQNFFFTNREHEDCDSFVKPSEDIPPENADSLLTLLENDIQCKNAFHLKQHMTLLIDTCKNQKTHSHIYVRFLSTNAVKLLLDSLPEKNGEMFDEYVQAIYHYKHFSEIEHLLKQLANQVSETFTEEPQYSRHALQLVKHYIQQHYGDDLSLDILADEICLSPRYLSSIFIKENGYGINQYIREVRMKKARELLLDTNLKITDISQKVGYPNLSYFCKSFSREYGITPEKFRNNPVDRERN